jgi:hypothetical protein
MLYYNWILNIDDKKLHENTAEAGEYIICSETLAKRPTSTRGNHSKQDGYVLLLSAIWWNAADDISLYCAEFIIFMPRL